MPRIDLKQTINDYVEQSWQYEETALIDYACTSTDWLTYYEQDIKRFLADNEISAEDIELLFEQSFWWIGEDTLTIAHGYFSCSYEFSIASTQELEISLEGIIKTPIKQSVVRAINQYTNLYIPDWNNEYGYCSTDLLSVCIDARKIKTWLEEHREDFNE